MTGPLKFVERLKAAGIPEAQARAMAEAQQEALSESVATQLATKIDLAELRLDVIKWMIGLALANILVGGHIGQATVISHRKGRRAGLIEYLRIAARMQRSGMWETTAKSRRGASGDPRQPPINGWAARTP
jgi:hypothetical protein